MTYDEWKLETPEDEYYRKHGSPRRGVYRVKVTREIFAETWIEVEASSEEDALFDAVIEAKKIPFAQWELAQDDYDTNDVDGPPERDPDDARDEEMDR
jgi:hypothetical protein